jgi:hypothetical protein
VKKGLWGILILALLLTIPTLYERSSTEWQNNTYEFIVPYDEITSWTSQDNNLDKSEVLTSLKDAGVGAISIEPDTLGSLEDKKVVSIIDDKDFREQLLFNHINFNEDNLPTKDGVYVYVSPDSPFNDNIQKAFTDDLSTVTVDGKQFYFITGDAKKIKDLPIGYNRKTIAEIESYGLHIVPRVPNGITDNNEFVFDQLLSLKGEKNRNILFSGDDVLGYSNHGLMKKWAAKFKDKGYSIFGVEFANQKGFSTYANVMDFNVIRLHSLDLDNKQSIDENADLIVRAVKERNIRALFLHLKQSDSPEKNLKETVRTIQAANSQMPGIFHLGTPKTFKHMDISLWQILAAIMGSIAFAMLAALTVINKKMAYLAFAGMTLVGLAYAVTGSSMFLKALALAVAIITPVFACLSFKKINGMKGVFLQYGKAALISVIGIWLIVTILVGNQYLVKIDAFRGVKLIYIAPIIFMIGYALWGNIKTLMRLSIRYWHLVVLILLSGVAFYYISRTGNSGSVSAIELKLRHSLEQILYVRPRTKEFLIGFPLYVLGVYIARFNKRIALYIFIPGVIGYLSIVNTFTHLHIPLYLSALRSVYSLSFGLIIGLIFIVVYNWGMKYYKSFQSGRLK